MTCDEIVSGLRMYLPEDIGVYSCKDVSAKFHARLNAKEKTYCYRLWNTENPCVFDRKYVYKDTRVFDLDAMREAAGYFIGTHDFSAFCANKHMKKSTVRAIRSFCIERVGDEIRFTVSGNGFLQHMVRIMVGTLLEVGTHSRAPEDINSLFGKARAEAGPAVDACGLCLMEVTY
jgi:tRNA pseudouridine38-40 synthase